MTETLPPADADPRRWKALWVLALALGLIVLDGSIVSVALPDIIKDLKLDITDAQWVNSLYSVIFSALLLISGRLGDRYGRRTLLVLGIACFISASMWAGLATSAASLIFARLIQGIGGALIMPSTLSTVNATFRGKERAAAFGIWGAVMSGAAALGPLLGGYLTTTFSWRWIFYVNVPIGIAIIVSALLWVRNTRAEGDDSGIDVVGALLSGPALALIVFSIIESSSLGWWVEKAPLKIFSFTLHGPDKLSVVPFTLVVGICLLVGFVLWEQHRARNQESVLLDLSLFKIPAFSWGNMTAMTVAIGEFGLLFVLPLYLVNVRGMKTLEAGFILAAMALGAFFSGAMARHIAGKFGSPATVIIGLTLEVIGVAGLGLALSPVTSTWLVVVVLVVYGIGLGLASAQLTSTVLKDVPTDQSGQGSATQSTVRQLGTALGASIAGALLASGLNQQIAEFSGPARQAAQAVHDSAGSALIGLRATHAPADLMLQLETYFTQAEKAAIVGALVFLGLGLIGSIQVARVAKREQASLAKS